MKAIIAAAVEALSISEPAQVTAVDLWSALISLVFPSTMTQKVAASPTSYLVADVVDIKFLKVATSPLT